MAVLRRTPSKSKRWARLKREVFGPVLHVVRFEGERLDAVCDAINATGYGLTLGIHSRIDETAEFIRSHVRVGNIYVNRNQIGAVVEAQPFGGEGLSGTGPKAGGPIIFPVLSRWSGLLTVNSAAFRRYLSWRTEAFSLRQWESMFKGLQIQTLEINRC